MDTRMTLEGHYSDSGYTMHYSARCAAYADMLNDVPHLDGCYLS
jgi:hypothetical protein